MGLNAQTAVPVFTAGQVLTAAQVTQINTGIPVFATTATRDLAFGGTGEKTLAQGQYAYIEASSTLQVYNGTAWVNTGSGLVYLTGTTFSAASSVSLPTDTFTSTYKNYLIIYTITAASTDSTVINARLRAAGTDATSALYSNAGVTYQIGATTIGAANILNGTSWQFTQFNSADRNKVQLQVLSPKVAADTNFFWDTYGRVGGAQGGGHGNGEYRATTQFDSLTLYPAAGTITGSYEVYGYSLS